MADSKQIPMFLFTGFLDSGKTTFVESTLEDKRFNDGKQRILVIRCEQGDEEYDLSAIGGENVFIRDVEDEEELNEVNFQRWAAETSADRVMVEYNGMWMLQQLFDIMPDNWIIAQEITFADSNMFSVYNANMRNLVFDKLKMCNVIQFNRCDDKTDTDLLHKAVRQCNRRCDIFYEYGDGKNVYDEKKDPLPFDMNAPVISIEDRDFAYFYAEIMENGKNFEKKTVEFTGFYPDSKKTLPEGMFVAGRLLMNCCAADTQFAGIACFCAKDKCPAKESWFRVRGKIRLQRDHLFSGKVPMMDVISIVPVSEPEDPVATFY